MTTPNENDIIDLFVIGGGINGCGIARDAAMNCTTTNVNWSVLVAVIS